MGGRLGCARTTTPGLSLTPATSREKNSEIQRKEAMSEEDEAVRRHVKRHAQRSVERVGGGRPVFDRAWFMKELTEDAPGLPFGAVVDVTNRFQRCVNRANNSLDGAMTPEGRTFRLKRFLESEFHLE
jgi:hypothetical protein